MRWARGSHPFRKEREKDGAPPVFSVHAFSRKSPRRGPGHPPVYVLNVTATSSGAAAKTTPLVITVTN